MLILSVIWEVLKAMKALTPKSRKQKNQDHVPCSFAYKVVCIDDSFTKPIVDFRGQNTVYEFIKAFQEYRYWVFQSNEQTL